MNCFISCDWGTSRLRLRLVDREQHRITAEHITDEGILKLAEIHPAKEGRAAFLGSELEKGIVALGVGSQTDLPVVISGMASSTLGWQSLPYASLPAPIDGSTLRFADLLHAGRRVRLVSGLRSASDVMRGEETELVGLFSNPARRALAQHCLVVLPGTHSKHVQLRAGEIVSFTTYLTGELYGLLCQNSTLAIPEDAAFDAEAFVAGAQAARSHGLSAALFQTRARVVLGHLTAQQSRAFLSGVLIGAEVAALAGVSTGQIVLAAGEQLARQYSMALNEFLPDVVVITVSPADLAAASALGQSVILSRL